MAHGLEREASIGAHPACFSGISHPSAIAH
jgi:hypothetical protein